MMRVYFKKNNKTYYELNCFHHQINDFNTLCKKLIKNNVRCIFKSINCIWKM